ncbi:MAG: FAD-dependent oxidoreductase [Candidatus Aureabacteria bacterium]|nr:FAD-dependent oxidoreductase [Candidatus Auribacterota bacterium]
MNNIKKVISIGCSGCGALAALMVKKLNPSLEVTIIREPQEKGLLTRCATPYICCGDVMVDPSYKDDNIFTGIGIKLVNDSAVRIDREKKAVMTADGNMHLYDKLILAVGAKPDMPLIPGIKLPGVFTLRTSSDAVNILNWINSRRVRSVVLVGAGAIGIEKAYLLSRQGVKVIVVEMFGHIMSNVLDSDMAKEVQSYIEAKGVQLKLNQKVVAINGKDCVENVTLSSGENIKADMVVVSTGARCNIQLARDAGLELGKLGLMVNRFLQTSDNNIYAGGDLIEYQNHITGKPSLGQLRPNAVIAGRVIAKNILGFNIEFPPFINAFCTKFFDKSIAGAGLTELEAKKEDIEIITAKERSFSKHSMMQGKKPYVVKLLFNRRNQKLIGGQIVSDTENPVKYIDVIALAIRCGLGVLDLTTLRCAGQPEMSPDPGKEPIALAAESAFEKIFVNEYAYDKQDKEVVQKT